MKRGVLIINLGTPDAPKTEQVRRYLREFLSDPRVIDLPALSRFLLVNGVIAPFRSPKAARAYAAIWTERGSPLLFHSVDLRDALRVELPECTVELGMRYGTPSIENALGHLEEAGCEHVLCVPLYPQYASSSTGSSIEEVRRVLSKRGDRTTLDVLPPFYDDDRFLTAQADRIRSVREFSSADHVLFSYHGLPEHHCKDSAPGHGCLERTTCCDKVVSTNRDCYRAQCYATTRSLQRLVGLDDSNSSVSFQSRMGRRPWIQPYTDIEIPLLAQRGVRRLVVTCPAFVADCLETLEEIEIRAAELFLEAGGKELALVPCLNSSPAWVSGLAQMIKSQILTTWADPSLSQGSPRTPVR